MSETEKVKIAELRQDAANARSHSAANIAAIKSSLKQFGQQRPILVMRDGVVIAGNGTLVAAKALGWKEIEVKWTGLTGKEARAYAIADNRTAELAEWDLPVLKDALLELDDGSFNMDATGFTQNEIELLMTAAAPEFTPGTEGDQGRLDIKKPIECPSCGHTWNP